jgi:hypothetical protein
MAEHSTVTTWQYETQEGSYQNIAHEVTKKSTSKKAFTPALNTDTPTRPQHTNTKLAPRYHKG